MPQRLTVIRIKGDPDQLFANKREHIDPVVQRKAPEHGAAWSVTAKTDDGIMIVNLWRDEEASDAAFADPEIQAALQAGQSDLPSPPERSHYEVADYFAA